MPGFNEQPEKTPRQESAADFDQLWLVPEVEQPLRAIPAYLEDGDLAAAKDAVQRVTDNLPHLNEADRSRILVLLSEYQRRIEVSESKR